MLKVIAVILMASGNRSGDMQPLAIYDTPESCVQALEYATKNESGYGFSYTCVPVLAVGHGQFAFPVPNSPTPLGRAFW